MQQRRGTSAQWTSADPILANGEIGVETDTNQFKLGDGVNVWSDLSYFKNLDDLAGSLDDYVLLSTKGQANGVATLDSNAQIPLSQLANLISSAPLALDTLNELAAALGNDANFATTILASVATKLPTSTFTTHAATTTNVHGIADTSVLATATTVATAKAEAISAAATYTSTAKSEAISAAATDATSKASSAAAEAATDATTKAATAKSEAIAAAASAADTKVSTHNTATTNVHGITDTAALATKTYADSAVSTAVSGLTKSSVGLSNVDNTSDANKPVSTATTTALALKANLASPTFTGTVSGITASMVGLGNVNNTADTAKPVSTAQQTALDAKLALSGGTMTGALTLSADPTSALHAVTKQYADGLAAGINFHQAVVAASAGNLAGVYNNGTNGLGATITASANGAIGTIDGATVSVGSRILLRAQTDATQNGIYTVTDLGSGSTKWVVTRATDADNNPAGELATGDFCFVTAGSTNAAKGYILSTTGTITIGTTNVNYTQFNASEAVTAGTNITKSGSTISVADAPTFAGLVTASAAGVAFSDGTQTKEGVVSRTPIIQKTAAYTLSALTERDSLIEVSSASAVTLTIPTNATLALPVGTSIDILQTSTGQVTIAGAAGVTVNATPGLKLRTQWSGATLFKRATDTWVVYGDLSA